MILGIDLSKRSTAAVLINMKGELVDFLLINPAKEIDGVEALVYLWDNLNKFLEKHKDNLYAVAIEGLTYNSTGASKDYLAACYWLTRVNLYLLYPDVLVGTVPNQSWFCWLVSKDERKMMLKVKDARKKIVVEKLPYIVRVRFEEYVRLLGVKKEALYDLADARGVALYRLSLETK